MSTPQYKGIQLEAHLNTQIKQLTDRVLDLKRELAVSKISIAVTVDGNRNMVIMLTNETGDAVSINVKEVDILNPRYDFDTLIKRIGSIACERYVLPSFHSELSSKMAHVIDKVRKASGGPLNSGGRL